MEPIKNNGNEFKMMRGKKVYPKDSIWQTPDGQWCYKNPIGLIKRQCKSEQEAMQARKTWLPQMSTLVRNGVIQGGDTISLKLYGEYSPFKLTFKGVRQKTLIFSSGNKEYSLGQIRQLAAEKSNKTVPTLNYNQTMHAPSGKSIAQLKREHATTLKEEIKAEKDTQHSFNFLEIVDANPEPEPKIELQYDANPGSPLLDFKSDFNKYESAQCDILSTMKTLSEEIMMDCYKDSLIMFLENTKTRE
jgi:hypothetical protein